MHEQEPHKQFEALYDTHARSLLRFAALKTSDDELAQDIVSETFLRYWKHFAAGEAIGNPRAFLFRIVRGLIIDHYRREEKRKQVPLEDLDEAALPVENALVGADIDRKQLVTETLAVLQSIGESYRDILLLRYVEDLDTQEIAQVLGKTQLVVRVTLHRATRALKKHMNL